VRIRSGQRRRMLERLRWCEQRLQVLAEDVEAHDTALGEVLADLRAGRRTHGHDLAALAVVADRRAAAGEEFLGPVRERGSLRLGLVASQNPFRSGGIAGRARSIGLVRARAEGDAASASTWAKELRDEALLIEMAGIGEVLLDDKDVNAVRPPTARARSQHRG